MAKDNNDRATVDALEKPKRGAPKTSPHTRPEQIRIAVKANKAAKKAAGLERVDARVLGDTKTFIAQVVAQVDGVKNQGQALDWMAAQLEAQKVLEKIK